MKQIKFLTEEALISFVRDNATTLCDIINKAFTLRLSPVSNYTNDDAHCDIPDVFCTEKAEILLGKLRRAGLLDQNNMPVGLSIAQKGVLASIVADRLGITNLWAAFGWLWHIKRNTLHKGYDKGMQQRGMSLFIDEVKMILYRD